jgi:hypothetical protein
MIHGKTITVFEGGEKLMSKLDLAKEQIAYLKLWLGILVAIIISLTGWLISNFQSVHWLLVFADAIALFIIGFAGYNIHRRIEEKITLLEEL